MAKRRPYAAIAVNGVVWAVVRTEKDGSFEVLVPAMAFRRGDNQIEALEVVGDEGGEVVLLRGRAPEFPKTEATPVVEVLGDVDGLTRSAGGALVLSGWAMSNGSKTPARKVVVYKDGQVVCSATTGRPRPKVAQAFGEQARLSGFRVELPEAIQGVEGLMVMGVTDSGATSALWITALKAKQ
jgi:hypothetical protein